MSLKILVVEDEPVRLKLVRSLAVSSGHTVYTFLGEGADFALSKSVTAGRIRPGARRHGLPWLERQEARHSLAPHYGSHLYLG